MRINKLRDIIVRSCKLYPMLFISEYWEGECLGKVYFVKLSEKYKMIVIFPELIQFNAVLGNLRR